VNVGGDPRGDAWVAVVVVGGVVGVLVGRAVRVAGGERVGARRLCCPCYRQRRDARENSGAFFPVIPLDCDSARMVGPCVRQLSRWEKRTTRRLVGGGFGKNHWFSLGSRVRPMASDGWCMPASIFQADGREARGFGLRSLTVPVGRGDRVVHGV